MKTLPIISKFFIIVDYVLLKAIYVTRRVIARVLLINLDVKYSGYLNYWQLNYGTISITNYVQFVNWMVCYLDTQ